MKSASKINIHRYCNKVALSLGGQPTVYVEQELASQLAAALTEAVVDISASPFVDSKFESRELSSAAAKQFPLQPGDELSKLEPLTKGALDKLPTIADPAFTEAMRELRGAVAKELPWHVVAVSTNAGSFGHKSVLVIREDGEGRELLLQAYGTAKLPVRGDILEVLPASEVQPRKLPATTPAKARKIISQLK